MVEYLTTNLEILIAGNAAGLALAVLIAIVLIYGFVILWLHSLRLGRISKISHFREKRNVLFVYPHPDDETFMSASLIRHLVSKNHNVHVISLTKGEKGNELIKVSERALAQIRAHEFKKAMKVLGVKHFQIKNFKDGELLNQKDLIKTFLSEFIEKNSIDTITTYEKTGLYGHKDHVALSQVVKEISSHYNLTRVLATIPARLEKVLNIRNKIKDLQLVKSSLCEQPTHKLVIFGSMWRKYKALKAYKSQNLTRGIPTLLFLLLLPVEYYREEIKSE